MVCSYSRRNVTLTRTSFFPIGSPSAFLTWHFRARQGDKEFSAFEICVWHHAAKWRQWLRWKKFASYFEIQPVSFSPGFLQLLFMEPDILMFSHNPGTVIGKGVFHFCRQDWAIWLGKIWYLREWVSKYMTINFHILAGLGRCDWGTDGAEVFCDTVSSGRWLRTFWRIVLFLVPRRREQCVNCNDHQFPRIDWVR